MTVALVDRAEALLGFHWKVLLFFTVATNIWPKLSSDQLPGSNVTSPVGEASPQPVKFDASCTTAPSLWADLVDPDAPRDIPVTVLPATPVYVINSSPTFNVPPLLLKPDTEVKVIVVPEPPVPFASSNNAPFNVVLVIVGFVPPYKPDPKP